MTAHTFETILFFVASTAVICTVIAIGAMVNRYLANRCLKAAPMMQPTAKSMNFPMPDRNK